MLMFRTMLHNQKRNQAEFDLMEGQLTKLLETSGEADRRQEGIRELRNVATLKRGDTESRYVAAQQCARVIWWLNRAIWRAEDACSLVYGIDPPSAPLADDTPLAHCHALDGRVLTEKSSEVNDAWVLLEALLAHMENEVQEAAAKPESLACEISPADFLNWCEDEGVDTSYLRLIRTLVGAGNGKLVGRLPLADVQIFKPGKQ
ncbi:hypothetical protein [Paraburkholderia adhaesiva]|uniref:hypothetical protein n=1 Tax=Paraburkholderia adhaesiva TaxID=2883244 RepID=UPI001F3A9392|nr:hypothetical protein [Paraburkholderia adhaesiva]